MGDASGSAFHLPGGREAINEPHPQRFGKHGLLQLSAQQKFRPLLVKGDSSL
jgi:hypothetical protein